MRAAALGLVALVALPTALAAEVAFHPPVQTEGAWDIQGVEWVYADLAAGSVIQLELADGLEGSAHTLEWTQVEAPEVAASTPSDSSSRRTAASPESRISISFPAGGGLAFEPLAGRIHADDLILSLMPAGACAIHVHDASPGHHPFAAYSHCMDHESVGMLGGLQETGPSKIRPLGWHGAAIVCSASECPPDTQRESTIVRAADSSVRTSTWHWVEWEAGTAEVLEWKPTKESTVAAGARGDITLDFEGSVRLPRALVAGCNAEGCPSGTETLTLAGSGSVADLRPGSEGRLHATIQAPNAAQFIDEKPTELNVLWAAAFAVPVSAILIKIASKLGLFALFTRLKPSEALEHPRRKLLHDYVKAHPGATFREIVRESGIPTGTARHHLSVLRRSDLLVEKPHKSTLRFFENHGKYDASWETLVMLREEPLAILHSWLSEHPGAMQKDIVQSMVDAHRWSRGTTQHRLGRLVEAGLVTVRAQGRLKLYTAHDSPQRATTQPAWAGLDANWPNPTYV